MERVMKKKVLKILAFFGFILVFTFGQKAIAAVPVKWAGRILQVAEKPGELWYVQDNGQRVLLNDCLKDSNCLQGKTINIWELDFQRLAAAGLPVVGDVDLAKKLVGKFLERGEKGGELWYLNPADLRKYRVDDLFQSSAERLSPAVAVSQKELATIHKPGLRESLNEYSSYESKKLKISRGTFSVEIIKISLDNPNLKVITATADSGDCQKNCKAKSLADFVFENKAFAGINGTYFCSDSSCVRNYYFYPVFNTPGNRLINEAQLKYWTTGPLMVFDEENNFYYFKDSREFKSVAAFEKKTGHQVRAALGNKPRLIEEGKNLLIDWEMDAKQANGKYARNAIAYKKGAFGSKGEIYLVIAGRATVPDLAEIMKSLQVDYALNLDGGASAALIYNDEYMVGPGRDIPNAVMFAQ